MNPKSLRAWLLCVCIGCGVNTGNPGDNSSKGTTMLLSLPASNLGNLGLNIVGVSMTGSGSKVAVSSDTTISAATGQKVTLFSKKVLPDDDYTEVELTLNTDEPLTYTDSSGTRQTVYVPPVQVLNAIECAAEEAEEEEFEEELEECIEESDDSRLAIILGAFKQNLTVAGTTEQIFSLEYDFLNEVISLDEAHPLIQEHFASQNLPGDTLIFDAAVSDLDFFEYDYDFEDCDLEEDCDEIGDSYGIVSIGILYLGVTQICLYDNSDEAQDDPDCEEAEAGGSLEEESYFESILESGTYTVIFKTESGNLDPQEIEVLPQEESYYELQSDGTLLRY